MDTFVHQFTFYINYAIQKIFLLEPENIIEEIKDDSNEIQESIVEEIVDRQAASDRVVELIVEKSTTSEVIEIVDNTKLDKSRKLSALVDSIAKKVSSSTFSYDSATATITPTRRPTLSRTKVKLSSDIYSFTKINKPITTNLIDWFI